MRDFNVLHSMFKRHTCDGMHNRRDAYKVKKKTVSEIKYIHFILFK